MLYATCYILLLLLLLLYYHYYYYIIHIQYTITDLADVAEEVGERPPGREVAAPGVNVLAEQRDLYIYIYIYM